LSAMSEEISAPVSAIQGFSELLKRLSSTEASNYRYIEQIYRYSQSLSVRFGELMSVVSLNEKRNELDYKTIDLEAFVRTTLQKFDGLVANGDVQIKQRYDLPTQMLWMDVKRTQLIIKNICEVAYQKVKSGGKFDVEVSHQNEGHQLRFKFAIWKNLDKPQTKKYGIPYQNSRPQTTDKSLRETFDLDIMLVERAVELLHGTMTREWFDEDQLCSILIEIPILQHQEQLI